MENEILNHSIDFTDNAACKVWSLIVEEGNFDLKLRAFITGGGCSGFQYGFKFEEIINVDNTDDIVIEKTILIEGIHQKVFLLIDPLSYQYLQGSEIDYREDIQGSQFVIRNPNAKTTCGCGSSFSVEDKS